MSFSIDRYKEESRKLDTTGIDWDAVREHPLSNGDLFCLHYMMDIENHVSLYLSHLLVTRACMDPVPRSTRLRNGFGIPHSELLQKPTPMMVSGSFASIAPPATVRTAAPDRRGRLDSSGFRRILRWAHSSIFPPQVRRRSEWIGWRRSPNSASQARICRGTNIYPTKTSLP